LILAGAKSFPNTPSWQQVLPADQFGRSEGSQCNCNTSVSMNLELNLASLKMLFPIVESFVHLLNLQEVVH
jgi:hypothetical protein